MQFIVDIEIVAGVRFHSLPVEKPVELRKVEVSEAVIPISKNIVQCLKVVSGFPVKVESYFNRMPAVEPEEDYKTDYNVQLCICKENPKEWFMVKELKPVLAYIRSREHLKIPKRKVYIKGVKVDSPVLPICPLEFERWGYVKPEMYRPQLVNNEDVLKELKDFIIPDIAKIISGYATTTPDVRDICDAGLIKSIPGKDLKIGDLIIYQQDSRMTTGYVSPIMIYRITRMTKKLYFYVEEVYNKYMTEEEEQKNGFDNTTIKYNTKKKFLGSTIRLCKSNYYKKFNYNGSCVWTNAGMCLETMTRKRY